MTVHHVTEEPCQQDDDIRCYYLERQQSSIKSVKWMIGIFIVLIGILVSATGWGLSRSTDAVDRVNKVREDYGQHTAAAKEITKSMRAQLDRIETGQRDNRKLLDQILRNGRGE